MAGNATLEEEFIALSKKIAALRKLEAEVEGSERERLQASRREGERATADTKKNKTTRQQKARQQSTGTLSDEDWWTKKIVGAAVLTGCAVLWGASAFLDGKA
jgi:phosphatidylinositol glycan class K